MQNTPNSNRTNIVIIGDTNVGKSSLLNSITEQEISIVSDVKGTTTDSVKKAMEFIPFGPVLFIDTAGFNDLTELGKLRIKKTINEIKKADFAIYVIDGNNFEISDFEKNISVLKKYSVPYIIAINKEDLLQESQKNEIKSKVKECYFISTKNRESILNFKEELIKKLNILDEEPSLLKGIIDYGEKILLVIPIDSEAPKGRLILPQVQIIRDALDNGIQVLMCRDSELDKTLEENKNINLVITDSQIFKKVDEILKNEIPLTSFSILFARQKGDLEKLIKGIEKIKSLKNGDKILISETCTHNTSHEDIGRVKIPKLLQKKLNKKFDFTFLAGKDFPEDLKEFSLVIHCGGCMITKKNMENRINYCNKNGVEITNYGLVLAYLNGILEKAIKSIS